MVKLGTSHQILYGVSLSLIDYAFRR